MFVILDCRTGRTGAHVGSTLRELCRTFRNDFLGPQDCRMTG